MPSPLTAPGRDVRIWHATDPHYHTLRHRDIDEAVERVAGHVVDWDGGTGIGDALKEFNRTWGRRVLCHRAIVLLIKRWLGPW
jgi:uncharacterized protein with von Willebrand factor type A (vWA) domain